MKKLILIVLILLTYFSLFAAYNLGVGLSVYGASDSTTNVAVDLLYNPFERTFLNPSISAQGSLSFGHLYTKLGGFRFIFNLELFKTMKNPLQFTLINKGPWAPSVSVGFDYNKKALLYAEISPFRVLDRDYIFQWFSLFALFDKKGIQKWGVVLLHFTPLNKVGQK